MNEAHGAAATDGMAAGALVGEEGLAAPQSLLLRARLQRPCRLGDENGKRDDGCGIGGHGLT